MNILLLPIAITRLVFRQCAARASTTKNMTKIYVIGMLAIRQRTAIVEHLRFPNSAVLKQICEKSVKTTE